MKMPGVTPTFLALAIALLPASGCSTGSEESPPSATETTADTAVGETSGVASAENAVDPVSGEVIYVPIYSRIFHQDARRTIGLAATLSVHNTDMAKPITLRRVRYYDLKGQLIKRFLDTDRVLQPMETINFVVEERDRSGGTGAKFIVEWDASTPVDSPIVEAVMISTSSTQGISFVTTGKVIHSLGAGIH